LEYQNANTSGKGKAGIRVGPQGVGGLSNAMGGLAGPRSGGQSPTDLPGRR
jgi:hypothetical protein